MTKKDFVEVVKIQACDGAVEATLTSLSKPPGRRPSQRDVELSNWYRSLSSENQAFLQVIVAETAQQAIFSFLVLLDGMASLGTDRAKGRMQLFYLEGERRLLLNDPAQEELHNLFHQLPTKVDLDAASGALQPHEVGLAVDLLGKSFPGDGLEIHHVPQRHGADATIVGYDAQSAPATALPKAEHRRIPAP